MTDTPNFDLPLPSLGQPIVGETGHVAELARALKLLDQYLALKLSGAFVSTDFFGDILSGISLRRGSTWSEPLTQSLLFAGTLDDLTDAGGVNSATWSPQLVFRGTELKDFIFRRPKASLFATYRLHIRLGDRSIASWPLVEGASLNGWTKLAYSHAAWDLWQYSALPEIEVHNVVLSVQSRTRPHRAEWIGELNIADGSLRGDTKLQDASVGTAKIGDNAVTTPKLADDAVTTPKLADGAITAPKLARGAVSSSDAIIPGALPGGVITARTLGTDQLADNAVNESKLADNAVNESKIADSSIVGSHFKSLNNLANTSDARAVFINRSKDTANTDDMGSIHINTSYGTQDPTVLSRPGVFIKSYVNRWRRIATTVELLGESDVSYLDEPENSGLINSPDNGRFALYTVYGSNITIGSGNSKPTDEDILQIVVRRSTQWSGRDAPPIMIQWKDVKDNTKVARSTVRGTTIAPTTSLRTHDTGGMHINFSTTGELVFQFQDFNDVPSRNTFQIRAYLM